jgi:glutaredoxin-related protein
MLTVKWHYANVNEGYDHDSKMLVYIDGKLIGESKVFKESAHASYDVQVPRGKHDVKIENYSFYEGKWDIHTKENRYSLDAFYNGKIAFSKSTTIDMNFDVAEETTEINVVGSKEIKPKAVPLTVTWIYKNVEEGYDHDNRMEVFVDGKKVGTSDIFKESKKGTMTVMVPAGEHEITIENYAYYEGNWELHSIENNYSVDSFYTTNLMFKKKRYINLVFDIETLETIPTVK